MWTYGPAHSPRFVRHPAVPVADPQQRRENCISASSAPPPSPPPQDQPAGYVYTIDAGVQRGLLQRGLHSRRPGASPSTSPPPACQPEHRRPCSAETGAARSAVAPAGNLLVPVASIRLSATDRPGDHRMELAGQPLVQGHLLVAVVNAAYTTSATAIASSTAGWNLLLGVGNTTTAHSRVAIFAKIAAGADAAPSFTSTTSGTGGMEAVLFELANASATMAASGTYASGASAGTIAP